MDDEFRWAVEAIIPGLKAIIRIFCLICRYEPYGASLKIYGAEGERIRPSIFTEISATIFVRPIG